MTTAHAPDATQKAQAPRFTGIEAVLFDAGDIIYHRPDRGAVLTAFLDRHAGGRKPDKSAVKHLKHDAWRGKVTRLDYYRAMLGTAGISDPNVLEEGAKMLEAEQHRITFLPGVATGMQALRRAGYRLGIVTNTHETTAEKLDWFAPVGLDAVWDVFVTSCEVGWIKPEAQIYQTALDALGLPAEAAIFVGHSAKEIAGALAVGLYTASFNPDTPDIGADVALDRLEDLSPLTLPGPEAARRSAVPRPGPAGLPVIAAHRGGALLWPENSMRAFRGALALQADIIETDIHLSADGIPVMLHDPTLDRTTHSAGPVRVRDAASLSTIPLRGAEEEGVSPLSALLALIAPTATDLRLEIKLDRDRQRYPGIEAAAATLLRQFGLLSRTTITSFDLPTLADFARIARPAGLIALIRASQIEAEGVETAFADALRHGVPEVAIPAALITAEMQALAASHGLRLGAHGVRDAETAARMIDLRVAAFTTDIPDQAMALRRSALARQSEALGRPL